MLKYFIYYRPQTKGGGWGVWPGGRRLQAHTQRGGLGVWPGGSTGPGLGGVSQHALRQTPPSRQLLLQTVRIPRERILVVFM